MILEMQPFRGCHVFNATVTTQTPAHHAILGSLLGTAVGDAIGLPYEGLSRRRGVRLFGEPNRHHFVFRGGMVSDDTEHTCIVLQALIASGGDVEVFGSQLAWGLRWWLLGLPAGIGLATLKASVKLWCGFSHRTSGVFSAGNGPAMRSAILGAAVEELSLLQSLVVVSTRITHTDPKAAYGALAVALAARLARTHSPVSGTQYLEELRSFLPKDVDHSFLESIERAVHSANAGESTVSFAQSQGWEKGVSGYVYHTVPIVIHAWLQNQGDLASGVGAVIRCGGDTDTTAAIVGGIIGAHVGKEGIPADWLNGLYEWPRTVRWIEQLAEAQSEGRKTPPLPAVGLLVRNALFFVVVLGHLVRRLLPPY